MVLLLYIIHKKHSEHEKIEIPRAKATELQLKPLNYTPLHVYMCGHGRLTLEVSLSL